MHTVLEFKIDDIYKAGSTSDELENCRRRFQSTNWMPEQNKAIFRALQLERRFTFIIIGLIVMVAALNILISLMHDGDGEDPRHCSADVDGDTQVVSAAHFHRAGFVD
jgi:hypothetical protein